jgi:acetoin utilization deacetylase AcuC-like enzyme
VRVVYDKLYGDHLRGLGHPESPDRVEVVAARLGERGLLSQLLPARDATDAELVRVHAAQYLELAKREIGGLKRPRYLSTGDVVVDARSLVVARRAAGGAIAAVEAAVKFHEPVFALVRPPGHHAEAARGMGFCLFNNAAIAARAYQAEHGGRVLVVDFDYHHGNGTQDVVGHGLSYVSTHAYPAYPGTGVEIETRGTDALANVQLPVNGISTEAFIAIWEALLVRVSAFVRPDAIVVSAGFDYVKGDPVGDLGVEVSAAASLTASINAVANAYCNGRVAYVLEGGYDIDALTDSVGHVITSTDAKVRAQSGASDAAIAVDQRLSIRRLEDVLNA